MDCFLGIVGSLDFLNLYMSLRTMHFVECNANKQGRSLRVLVGSFEQSRCFCNLFFWSVKSCFVASLH